MVINKLMRKIAVGSIIILVLVTGCSNNQTSTPTSADNDLLAVENINRIQTAYQTDLVEDLKFYINDEVVDDHLTLKTGNSLSIESTGLVTLTYSYLDESGSVATKTAEGTDFKVDINGLQAVECDLSTESNANVTLSIQ